MRKQHVLFLMIFLFTLGAGFAQNAPTTGNKLTLQQCIDIAIKNNLQVRQNEYSMEQSGVALKQSKDNLLPYLSASGSQGISYGRTITSANNSYINQQTDFGSYGLSAGITLFSGLQLQNAIKQNKYAYDASKLDWQQQKDNITLNVILAYLQVLSDEDLLSSTREQTNVDSQNVARTQIQFKEGAIAPYTLTDLQGQYASDLVSIATSINALESAKISLYQYLNIPYNRDVELERIPVDVQVPVYGNNSDSIYQTALQTIPAIKSADLRVKSYEKALKLARGQYFPTLSLNGGVSTNYSSAATNSYEGAPFFNDTTSSYVSTGAGDYFVIQKIPTITNVKQSFGDQFKNNRGEQVYLSLQIPILNNFRARNNVKLAKINLEYYKFVASNTRLQLQQQVEQAYQNMVAAYNEYKSYQDQVAAYTQSFRAAEVRFHAGVITSVDYVIAKNNMDRANLNLVASRYNYIFRTKILDYYEGRLSW